MKKKETSKPIYLQLREIIRNKIEEGEYMPGTAIPSENKLSEIYGINRITTRNAVEALVNEGLLRRVQGKGVFVVGNKNIVSIEEQNGFINDIKDSRAYVKEIKKIIRPAGNKYATIFNIDVDDEIYFINQIQYIGDDVCSVQELYITKDILPSLDTINTSVFSFKDIMSFYGIKLKKTTQTLKIIEGDKKSKKMLNVPYSVAIMVLECNYYGEKNNIIAQSINYIRSDIQSFTVNLHK